MGNVSSSVEKKSKEKRRSGKKEAKAGTLTPGQAGETGESGEMENRSIENDRRNNSILWRNWWWNVVPII